MSNKLKRKLSIKNHDGVCLFQTYNRTHGYHRIQKPRTSSTCLICREVYPHTDRPVQQAVRSVINVNVTGSLPSAVNQTEKDHVTTTNRPATDTSSVALQLLTTFTTRN